MRASKPTRTRSHLDNGGFGKTTGSAGDLAGQVQVEEEVLAERFASLKAVLLDDFS
jgi:hypothetical protein